MASLMVQYVREGREGQIHPALITGFRATMGWPCWIDAVGGGFGVSDSLRTMTERYEAALRERVALLGPEAAVTVPGQPVRSR